jgi:hypothetical protein
MADEKDPYEDVVKTIFCKSAEEFVNTLRKSNDLFARGTSSPFVFRGHNNASYDLIPSFFRPDVLSSKAFLHWLDFFLIYLDHSDNPEVDILTSEGKRIRHSRVLTNIENKLLVDFALKANAIGLHVPELEKALGENGHVDRHSCNVDRSIFMIHTKKLGDRILPLYAGLAQHHGVKTRLLDFTYNPQKAIFFAIKDAKVVNCEEDYICVWAIPLEVFDDKWLYSSEDILEVSNGNSIFSKYSKMLMATSVNDFLYRQEGLFLYPVFPHEYHFKFDKYPSVLDFLRYIKSNVKPELQVFKVMVPALFKGQIDRLLTLEGITLASLMPTFDHIVEEMNLSPGR